MFFTKNIIPIKKDASKKSEPKKTEKPSQPAEQKQKTKSTKIESGPRFDRHRITMESDGTGVGSLEMSHDKQKKTVEVRAIDAIQKGQGVGVKLYGAAMEQAKQLGAETFGSDFKVSDSAYQSWQRLKQSLGDAVKENPSKNNGNQREGEGPIFEVDLSKLSAEQIKKLKEQGTK
jgi:predicted GNAT family acetyltransferase